LLQQLEPRVSPSHPAAARSAGRRSSPVRERCTLPGDDVVVVGSGSGIGRTPAGTVSENITYW
jgi:hypothetical protein